MRVLHGFSWQRFGVTLQTKTTKQPGPMSFSSNTSLHMWNCTSQVLRGLRGLEGNRVFSVPSAATSGTPFLAKLLPRRRSLSVRSAEWKPPNFICSRSSVVQWHRFFLPVFLVVAPPKMVQAPTRLPFFPRVTETF